MLKRHVNVTHLLSLLLVRYVIYFIMLANAAVSIGFSSRFTYKYIPEASTTSHSLGIWANFDGVHYLGVAREGYHDIDRAFFPLYPFLIQIIHRTTSANIFYTGLILSQLFFIGGLFLLEKVLREIYKVKDGYRFLILLLAYPTAFYFSAVYTESLFFFLVMLSLVLMHKKKYYYLFLVLICASLTRIQGVFLLFPLFFSLYDSNESFKTNLISIFTKKYIIYAPFVGLFLYMLYLLQTTGNPLYFLSVQSSFGAHRSSALVLLPQVIVRYFRIFLTASWNFQYFIAVIEFVLFNLCLIFSGIHLYTSYKHKRLNDLGVAMFSLANVLLPTLTGTLSSMPRYSLFALSTFFVVTTFRPSIQFLILCIFVILQCTLLAFFAQGYFVS